MFCGFEGEKRTAFWRLFESVVGVGWQKFFSGFKKLSFGFKNGLMRCLVEISLFVSLLWFKFCLMV
mgnify:CR=1 FL=1